MPWSHAANGNMPQKKYGEMLVRKMGMYYWVISLGSFAGLIMLETRNIREAIRYAKNPPQKGWEAE